MYNIYTEQKRNDKIKAKEKEVQTYIKYRKKFKSNIKEYKCNYLI